MEFRPKVWLAVVAAFVAVLYLINSVGGRPGAALIVAAGVGYGVYRWLHGRDLGRGAIRCLKCGHILPSTARQCDSCGSASWTWRN